VINAPETKLGDIAEFIRGINFKPDDVVPLGTEGSVGCMRTKNVQDELDCIDVWGVPKKFVRRDEQLLKEGDILVSSANSWNLVGKCCWIPKLDWPASFGGFVSVLRANPLKVDPRFLYRWFASNPTQSLLRSFGQKTTNISNLNIERCLNLKLVLPPLPEQRRIAAILDQADALRAKRREALAELDQISESTFLEMFGDPVSNPLNWTRAKLVELLSSGPQNGLYKPASDYGDGTPILRIDGFYDGIVTNLGSLKRVRIGDNELQTWRLFEGDIVINRVNSREYLGKSALIPSLAEPTIFESNMMRFSIKDDKALPQYIIQFLQTAYIRGQIAAAAKDAVNQSSINQQDVKGFIVNLPPVELQRKFKSRQEFVNRIKVPYRKSLEAYNSLFSSLQHRAFRGEL
jgi:type I restriction enzyme S subunit